MFNSVLAILEANVASVSVWWDSLSSSYRGSGCMLFSFFLMWQATKAAEERDRRFFLTGLAALLLLGYGAVTFINGNGGAQ